MISPSYGYHQHTRTQLMRSADEVQKFFCYDFHVFRHITGEILSLAVCVRCYRKRTQNSYYHNEQNCFLWPDFIGFLHIFYEQCLRLAIYIGTDVVYVIGQRSASFCSFASYFASNYEMCRQMSYFCVCFFHLLLFNKSQSRSVRCKYERRVVLLRWFCFCGWKLKLVSTPLKFCKMQ